MMAQDMTAVDRAMGAFFGLALGDAMGMPSQTLTRAQIAAHYGQITNFLPPYDGHPVSHGLTTAQITDDTEQTVLLARRLIASAGVFDEENWAYDLLEWEKGVRARGLHDLLGPSTKRALESLLAGAPVTETGRIGTTNGAAMRILPIGISVSIDPLADFVARVAQTCRVTHNTGEAIAGAAAVAAIISAGIDGCGFEDAIPRALQAAQLGQTFGYSKGESDMVGRIVAALDCAATNPSLAAFAVQTGSSVASFHSIPAAFGIVRLADGDPWRAACLAANIGDDTDTIGALAGAMSGACSGLSSLPADKIEVLKQANDLSIETLTNALLHLREAQESKQVANEGCQ